MPYVAFIITIAFPNGHPNVRDWYDLSVILYSPINQSKYCYPFKYKFHKMVKHTQTIRQQNADELCECVWPLFGIGG